VRSVWTTGRRRAPLSRPRRPVFRRHAQDVAIR
jgi:hypothetical protein